MMAAASDTILRVLSAGLGATLQDAGRHGYLRFGVTAAGPMDRLAHAAANLAVGNPADATAIEVSVGGIEVTVESAPLHIAVAGGDFSLSLDGRPLPPAVVLNLHEGAALKIRAGGSGSWCYLAVAGRFVVPKVLGSHATHTRTGFGGVRSQPVIIWESSDPDGRRRRRAPSWRPGSTAPSTPCAWFSVLNTTTSPMTRSLHFWRVPGRSPPGAIAWRIFSMDRG
jgi:hypothetical protein